MPHPWKTGRAGSSFHLEHLAGRAGGLPWALLTAEASIRQHLDQRRIPVCAPRPLAKSWHHIIIIQKNPKEKSIFIGKRNAKFKSVKRIQTKNIFYWWKCFNTMKCVHETRNCCCGRNSPFGAPAACSCGVVSKMINAELLLNEKSCAQIRNQSNAHMLCDSCHTYLILDIELSCRSCRFDITTLCQKPNLMHTYHMK